MTYLNVLFLFFSGKKNLHFMQTVSLSILFSWKNRKNQVLAAMHGPYSLSVAFVHRHTTVYLWGFFFLFFVFVCLFVCLFVFLLLFFFFCFFFFFFFFLFFFFFFFCFVFVICFLIY